ncbi:MAG: hypothetical protein FWF92_07910 [Oscillospiraceae bacterium]|nr:hypothetical protein [Oscillospiraceae bacterium]
MNKKTKIIIIIIAALIVLGVAGFFIYKNIKDKNREPDMPNVTLFKCHIGKTITDSDLTEIKEVINNAVGNKVLEIEKGSIPYKEYLTDENEEVLDVEIGDSITITFSVLTDDEKVIVFNALAEKYGITPDYLVEGLGKDIYRPDYK